MAATTKAAKQQAKREREARKQQHLKLVKALKGFDPRQMNLFSNLVRTVAAQGMIVDVRDGESEEQAIARVKRGVTEVFEAAAPAATTGGPTDPPEPPKGKKAKVPKAKKAGKAPANAPTVPADAEKARKGEELVTLYWRRWNRETDKRFHPDNIEASRVSVPKGSDIAAILVAAYAAGHPVRNPSTGFFECHSKDGVWRRANLRRMETDTNRKAGGIAFADWKSMSKTEKARAEKVDATAAKRKLDAIAKGAK